ncbi:hypothetical protein F320042A7_54440 [Blautia producta]
MQANDRSPVKMTWELYARIWLQNGIPKRTGTSNLQIVLSHLEEKSGGAAGKDMNGSLS